MPASPPAAVPPETSAAIAAAEAMAEAMLLAEKEPTALESYGKVKTVREKCVVGPFRKRIEPGKKVAPTDDMMSATSAASGTEVDGDVQHESTNVSEEEC